MPGSDDGPLTATYVGVLAVQAAILLFLWLLARVFGA
jgi:hypothetical protein